VWDPKHQISQEVDVPEYPENCEFEFILYDPAHPELSKPPPMQAPRAPKQIATLAPSSTAPVERAAKRNKTRAPLSVQVGAANRPLVTPAPAPKPTYFDKILSRREEAAQNEGVKKRKITLSRRAEGRD